GLLGVGVGEGGVELDHDEAGPRRGGGRVEVPGQEAGGGGDDLVGLHGGCEGGDAALAGGEGDLAVPDHGFDLLGGGDAGGVQDVAARPGVDHDLHPGPTGGEVLLDAVEGVGQLAVGGERGQLGVGGLVGGEAAEHHGHHGEHGQGDA